MAAQLSRSGRDAVRTNLTHQPSFLFGTASLAPHRFRGLTQAHAGTSQLAATAPPTVNARAGATAYDSMSVADRLRRDPAIAAEIDRWA